MIVLCYHNGALGNTTRALFECCTEEGNSELPSFFTGQNLHHFKPKDKIIHVKHPDCNIDSELKANNTVVSSTSSSLYGRYMILLMGLKKWNSKVPDFNDPSIYSQDGSNFGEQLEILALTLVEKINQKQDWFENACHKIEILDYWNNVDNLYNTIKSCGLSPDYNKIKHFSKLVCNANGAYYNKIKECYKVVELVKEKRKQKISLDFFQSAVCYGLLLQTTKVNHKEVKLINQMPNSTENFIKSFNL